MVLLFIAFPVLRVARTISVCFRFFEPGKDSIRVSTTRRPYEARVLAGADGIRGTVHRLLTSGSSVMRILGYEAEKNADPEEEKKYFDSAALDLPSFVEIRDYMICDRKHCGQPRRFDAEQKIGNRMHLSSSR